MPIENETTTTMTTTSNEGKNQPNVLEKMHRNACMRTNTKTTTEQFHPKKVISSIATTKIAMKRKSLPFKFKFQNGTVLYRWRRKTHIFWVPLRESLECMYSTMWTEQNRAVLKEIILFIAVVVAAAAVNALTSFVIVFQCTQLWDGNAIRIPRLISMHSNSSIAMNEWMNEWTIKWKRNNEKDGWWFNKGMDEKFVLLCVPYDWMRDCVRVCFDSTKFSKVRVIQYFIEWTPRSKKKVLTNWIALIILNHHLMIELFIISIEYFCMNV